MVDNVEVMLFYLRPCAWCSRVYASLQSTPQFVMDYCYCDSHRRTFNLTVLIILLQIPLKSVFSDTLFLNFRLVKFFGGSK